MDLKLNDVRTKYNQLLEFIYFYKNKNGHFPTHLNRNLYVGKSKITGAGRGVFTKKYIKKNTILEIFPTISIVGDIGENRRYTYGSKIIGGGLTPFYNSSIDEKESNILSEIISPPGFDSSIIVIYTTKNVKAHSELYLYYYGTSFEAGYQLDLSKEI